DPPPTMTTSYELLSSAWRRHIRRLRKMSRMRGAHLLEGVDSHRAAAEVGRGVGHDAPHVLARGPAEEEQISVLRLADDDSRLAPDRPRPQRAHGRDRGAQVK